MPAPHVVHTADVDAVATVLYQPVPHALHVLVPVTRLLYAPVGHEVQKRGLLAAETPLYFPATQAVHDSEENAG